MKPILFNSEMVRAVLDGRKTQTRRIAKLPAKWHKGKASFENNPNGDEDFVIHGDCGTETMYCPYGRVGDKLWVREKWRPLYEYCNPNRGIIGACFRYRGGGRVFKEKCGHIDDTYNFKPSIHMPRWASCITLKITNIWIERVQQINEGNSCSEGIKTYWDGTQHWYKNYLGSCDFNGYKGAKNSFHSLWDSINAKRGYGWEKNPWVWVVEFEVIK